MLCEQDTKHSVIGYQDYQTYTVDWSALKYMQKMKVKKKKGWNAIQATADQLDTMNLTLFSRFLFLRIVFFLCFFFS